MSSPTESSSTSIATTGRGARCAASMSRSPKPNRRYLNQDDRVEIADGLTAGESVKMIAARIGKSYQSVYREIARNSKRDGRY
jgi:transposase, IS30 family